MQLSYQLYSSRDFPPLLETLKMIKSTGYDQVEGYGEIYRDLAGLCEALVTCGLTMPSGHFDLDMLENDVGRVLEIATKTDMKAIICPYLAVEMRPCDPSDWYDFGVRLDKIGQPYRDAGLTFGWHNHDFEFAPLEGGSTPLEQMFNGGPKLLWQADLAWLVRAAADPVGWIKRFGERINTVHIKDIARQGECADEDGWADVGHGIFDWPNIWDALKKTPAGIFIVEHDNPSDHQRFARRSFESIRSFQEPEIV